MSLNRSQIYYIRKAKGRKVKAIIAAVNRTLGPGRSPLTIRIVKNQINKELYRLFGVKQIAEIPEMHYERALDIIKKFKLYYCGDYYG